MAADYFDVAKIMKWEHLAGLSSASKAIDKGGKLNSIGEKLGVTGAVGEYRYISTPYDEQRRRNAQENREQRRSAQGDTNGRRSASPLRPFKPSSPPKFGKAGYPGLTLAPVPGIVGEYVYMELGVEKASKKVCARGRRPRRRRRRRRARPPPHRS